MNLFGLFVLAGLIAFFFVAPGVAFAVAVIVAIAYVGYQLDKAHNEAAIEAGEREPKNYE
jgi:hypothetical protein